LAADGVIRIRVGASADRSVETVFGGIDKRALKTRDNINKALGGSGMQQSMQGIERAARRSADGVDKVWNQELAKLNRIAKAQDRLFERVEANKVRVAERAARDRVRLEEKAARDIEKANRDAQRRADREASSAERTRRQFAERTSWRATKFLVPPPMGALGAGRRIAGDMLRGAGVDFSLQGSVQRAVSLQSRGIALANAERIATGSTRGGNAYSEIARSVGEKYSVGPDKVQDLMDRFAAVSGNYKDLDQIAPQLASMATASGAQDFGAYGNAAAMVFNQLKGGPDAVGGTMAIMRGTLGQAAEGAVDPADYAKHMGRIAAGAFKFEGDRGQNVLKLSALTQLAMERGATSPADAARATSSFVNTFGKNARIKAFRKNDINPYTDESESTLRDPFELIKESFRKTNGNIPELSAMFMDVLGRKGVDSLGAVYKGAGGGEAGISAIQKEFDRYMGAQLTKGTEDKNNADYQQSIAAKAQKFQNNLDKIVATMAEDVLPSLEKLGPSALKFAEFCASIVEFAADMPVTFGGLVVAAAVLRAGLESWARAALEKRIMGMPTGTPGLPGAGPAGMGMGGWFTGGGGYTGARGVVNSAAGGMVATLGAAYAIDMANDQANSFRQENGGMGVASVAWDAAMNGSLFSEGLDGMFKVIDAKMNADAVARADAEARVASGGGDGAGKNAIPMTAEEYANALAAANAKGVRITNLADIKLQPPPPVVSPGGRSPSPN
jgi:hypothetical protein